MIEDHHTEDLEHGKNGLPVRLNSCGPSRRNSSSMHFDDLIDTESVSEAGDIGVRTLSRRLSASGKILTTAENFAGRESILPIDGETGSSEEKKVEEQLSWLLEMIAYHIFLAFFGILGVIVRYYLKKLFGPEVVRLTSETYPLYPDLLANMVGSFLMGWFGVVFKEDISKVSDQLAVGLSTGFLGSLTTFSGWNQSTVDLTAKGHRVFGLFCVAIGLILVDGSISFGVCTAEGFRWLYNKSNKQPKSSSTEACISKKFNCVWTSTIMLLLLLGVLWGTFGVLEVKHFRKDGNEAQLFLGCLVGPFGVWLRWHLARFNGLGLGRNGVLKWIPFGTLAANVFAACIMAALATYKIEMKLTNVDTIVNGIQLGLLGCLSTVSTFIAEFHAMKRESMHSWRAGVYAAMTFLTSFVLGTLLYSVPVWARGLN